MTPQPPQDDPLPTEDELMRSIDHALQQIQRRRDRLDAPANPYREELEMISQAEEAGIAPFRHRSLAVGVEIHPLYLCIVQRGLMALESDSEEQRRAFVRQILATYR
jgi:hypothetical protein